MTKEIQRIAANADLLCYAAFRRVVSDMSTIQGKGRWWLATQGVASGLACLGLREAARWA